MFDRLLMPALTFTLLAGALAAFSLDAIHSQPSRQTVVQLERVVVTATRELPASPVAQAAASTGVLR